MAASNTANIVLVTPEIYFLVRSSLDYYFTSSAATMLQTSPFHAPRLRFMILLSHFHIYTIKITKELYKYVQSRYKSQLMFPQGIN